MSFQVYRNVNAFSVYYYAACLNVADFNFNLRDATLPSTVSLLRSFCFLSVSNLLLKCYCYPEKCLKDNYRDYTIIDYQPLQSSVVGGSPLFCKYNLLLWEIRLNIQLNNLNSHVRLSMGA